MARAMEVDVKLGCSIPILASAMVACSGGDDGSPISGVQSLCDPVSNDDLILTAQADVDASADLQIVTGDVLLCNSTEIETLSLPLLTEVHGNIIVFDNTILTGVDLPLLEAIGTDPSRLRSWNGFLIEGNEALTDVDAPLLRDVNEHVWVADNAVLTAFDLPALTRVRGALALRATQVVTLDGFNELRFIGDALALYDNTELTEVTGLTNLVTVSSELLFTNNPELTTINLPVLHTVGGTVELAEVAALATFDAPALATVGRGFTITGTALTDTSGLGGLTTVAGDFALTYNSALADLTLPAQLIGGDLQVSNNALVTSITADQLSLIGDSLILSENDALAAASFATLIDIGGDLVVSNNTDFPTCAAEGLRDDIGTENIGGDVSIAGNDDAGTCP